MAGLAVFFLIFFGAVKLANFYTESEFKVFYSLDAKENDQEITRVINGADKYVYFAVYTFTKNNIADALIAAKNRGLDVEGITDRDQAALDSEKPVVEKLRAAGIPVETQKHPDGIMHVKAVVTDNTYAMGSYNWTESATVANDELLEVGTNKNLVGIYTAILKRILEENSSGADTGAVASVPAPSETISGIYDFSEAQNHIGEYAEVKGTAIEIYTSQSGVTFIDYCKVYKTCPFSAVIFSSDLQKFGDLKKYSGLPISIKGLIKTFNGEAEIVLTDPTQIVN